MLLLQGFVNHRRVNLRIASILAAVVLVLHSSTVPVRSMLVFLVLRQSNNSALLVVFLNRRFNSTVRFDLMRFGQNSGVFGITREGTYIPVPIYRIYISYRAAAQQTGMNKHHCNNRKRKGGGATNQSINHAILWRLLLLFATRNQPEASILRSRKCCNGRVPV